jgi:hypothetical protein
MGNGTLESDCGAAGQSQPVSTWDHWRLVLEVLGLIVGVLLLSVGRAHFSARQQVRG